MKHIIFDLDGTLTDSGEGIINSVLYAYEKMGLPAPPESKHREFVGPPLSESFAAHGVPADRIDEAIKTYRERYVGGGGKYENMVYPGIPELLEKLRAAGCALYVGTSKPEPVSNDILKKFDLHKYFDIIAGATEDLTRETKTQVLEYLVEQIETKDKDDELIMVGDTKYDVLGATDLSIPCIGVAWGYGKPEDMQSAGAAGIAKDTEELFAMLTKK